MSGLRTPDSNYFAEPTIKQEAPAPKQPIYHVARTLGYFLFTSLNEDHGEEANGEIWKFFVALCCYLGLYVEESHRTDRTTFFVKVVGDSSTKSAFSLSPEIMSTRSVFSTNFSTVLRNGYTFLNEYLPEEKRVVTVFHEDLLNDGFLEDNDNLDKITDIMESIEAVHLQPKVTAKKNFTGILTFLEKRRMQK